MWLQRNQGNTRAEINNAILCFFFYKATSDWCYLHCCVGILSVSVMLSNTATEVCNEMNFIPFNDGMLWKLAHLKCIWSARNEILTDMHFLHFHFISWHLVDISQILKVLGLDWCFHIRDFSVVWVLMIDTDTQRGKTKTKLSDYDWSDAVWPGGWWLDALPDGMDSFSVSVFVVIWVTLRQVHRFVYWWWVKTKRPKYRFRSSSATIK